jgi:hypothetical protein
MAYRIKILPVTEKQIRASIIPKYTIMVLPEKGSAIRPSPELIKELNMCLANTLLGISGNEVAEQNALDLSSPKE